VSSSLSFFFFSIRTISFFLEDTPVVRVGDRILINGRIQAEITALFLLADGRWFIGYKQLNGKTGFFLEGDEKFCVVDKVVNQKRLDCG
jgi:hypothetical protein